MTQKADHGIPSKDHNVTWSGKNYEPEELTLSHLKQIAYELGLITLSWPPLEQPTFEGRRKWPESYITNSDKEKLALLYAENFRRQFINLFPNRRQLVLAADNECGLQKLVCTTLRVTHLPYAELKQWDTCARFVADNISYETMDKPTLVPERIMSPHTVFKRQSGNSFELASCLCSLLLAAGYDAYVVSGYATRDITLRLLVRTDCPIKSGDREVVVAEEELPVNKYRLRSVRDLRSKFLMFLEQREIDRAEAERLRFKMERLREMELLERAPPDDLYGWRIHAWVVLLPKREIEKPTFIEPSTAVFYSVDTPAYIAIESIWNDINYWVNVHDQTFPISELSWDLQDLKFWEHIFIGEPFEKRRCNMDPEADTDKNPAADEKHMDCPTSWGEAIDIPHEILKTRFPNGSKVSRYKRVILEQFGEYVMQDGLKHRITYYSDLECEHPMTVEECYENRKDCLTTIYRDLQTDIVTEYFKLGRDGACKTHVYYSKESDIESSRTLEFYHTSRIDGLKRLEMNPLYLLEDFVNREDRLYSRLTKFATRGKPPKGMVEGVRRIITNIIEKYERNESKSAHEDVAQKEFALVDNEIRIKYHYGKGNVTASTRDFIKPNVAEMGDDLTFNPDLTSGYMAEIGEKPPKHLALFYQLQQQLEDEEKCLYHLREIEDELASFVRLRTIESALTHLYVSLFNQELNEDYKIGMKEREQQINDSKAREVDEDIDYLSPYIMRTGTQFLTKTQIAELKKECLADFKKLLLDRAVQLQATFNRELQKMVKEHQVYEANLKDMAREDEEKYLKEVSKKKYAMNILEKRLTRHKELSLYRYQALENYLNNDKRLVVRKIH